MKETTLHQDELPFETTQPEAVGVPSVAVLRFLQALEQNKYRLHAFILLRRGKICFASAAAPYTLSTPHRVYSAGKSILALSACRAIQDGKMKPTDKVADLFRDLLDGDTRFDNMTIDDLLTMRSGQEEDPFLALFKDLNADITRLFFAAPPVEAPGKTFRYNNTIPTIVTQAVERAVGEPFEGYQTRHFAEPMGAPIYAPTDTRGSYNPVVMAMTPITLMKYVALFLQEGNWQGQQLLDADILRQCVREHTQTGQPDNFAGYGWQTWRNAFGGFRLDGGFGQYGIVLPEEDMAAVLMSDMPDSTYALEAFEKYIVGALSGETLETDKNAYWQLLTYGRMLSLAPKGGKQSGGKEDQWFSKRYRFEALDADISFVQKEGAIDLLYKDSAGLQTVPIGLNGQWMPSPRHLLVKPEITIDNGVYCADPDACQFTAIWRSDSTLKIAAKSLAAQGEYLYRFTFEDDGVTLTYAKRPLRGWPTLKDAVCLYGKGVNA